MGAVQTQSQIDHEARKAHGRFVRHVNTCPRCLRSSGEGRGWCPEGDRREREADVMGNRSLAMAGY